ncbi:MerR family transcriptional regulator [Lactococcus termiticola]|uniref:MerR family transcriptional regulator n=1 Tax=Lactococcus termiticola TaxID=2169526 RepID=A0A2R5HFV7_9LACT|nr:MerR family transcriptional regulator [Lactococcus termiticola]GBG96716.1 MerR family transcriptional regulator [Lactococcus termiticola]
MKKNYKISEIADLTGFSVATLRYYEEIGLIKPQRNQSNYRSFSEQDLSWLEFIQKAKATGMSLDKILEYSHLREQGDSTIEARLLLLDEQEGLLQAKIQELQGHIAFIQNKKKSYQDYQNQDL